MMRGKIRLRGFEIVIVIDRSYEIADEIFSSRGLSAGDRLVILNPFELATYSLPLVQRVTKLR